MQMKMRQLFLLLCLLAGFALDAMAQDRNYNPGPVTDVTFVKVKPGKFNEYMVYLAGSYRAVMEENKKAGLILDWRIYGNQARDPHDADIVLTVTYPNLATSEKIEAFEETAARVFGSQTEQAKKAVDRESLREVLGSQRVRQLVFK
jgi:hypothetical protein